MQSYPLVVKAWKTIKLIKNQQPDDIDADQNSEPEEEAAVGNLPEKNGSHNGRQAGTDQKGDRYRTG